MTVGLDVRPVGLFALFDLLALHARLLGGEHPRHGHGRLGGHCRRVGNGGGEPALGVEHGHGGVDAHGALRATAAC